MEILYLDIYFLINLTVDTIALYFAIILAKVKSSKARLLIGGIIGAIFACITALFELKTFFYIIILLSSALLIMITVSGACSLLKKIKLLTSFLFFETMIGGAVSFLYSTMDRYIYPLLKDGKYGVENRELLILAIMILMSFGLIKLFSFILSGSVQECCVELTMDLFGHRIEALGLVDSGNLLKDPMTLKPVIVLKAEKLKGKLGDISLARFYSGDDEKTRMRIIPAGGLAGEKILLGLKSDVSIRKSKKEYKIEAVVAFDEEEGSFGGYDALVPSELIM